MKLALIIAALASSATVPTYHGRPCARTYTLGMFDRASDATYRGTRLPAIGAYSRLHRYEGCQRLATDIRRARAVWTTDKAQWTRRRAVVVLSPLARCIIYRESTNGTTSSNIAQWQGSAWAEDGGLRYAPSPYSATYTQQEIILMQALARGESWRWRPFDGC